MRLRKVRSDRSRLPRIYKKGLCMNITDATFMIVDVETTGLDPKSDRIVEIAAVATTSDRVLGMWASLVNPNTLIPPEVSAVHLLTDRDVVGAPDWETVRPWFESFVAGSDLRNEPIIVAHNAVFDAGFVNPEHVDKWLCTKRLAQHLWPDAPTYKNQGLRFWRELQVDVFGILPHRALADALVTAALLRDILTSVEIKSGRQIYTVDDLLALSKRPIRYKKWPLGKHRDKPLDVDISYAQWALRSMSDMDPDLRWSLNEVLRVHA